MCTYVVLIQASHPLSLILYQYKQLIGTLWTLYHSYCKCHRDQNDNTSVQIDMRPAVHPRTFILLYCTLIHIMWPFCMGQTGAQKLLNYSDGPNLIVDALHFPSRTAVDTSVRIFYNYLKKYPTTITARVTSF